ncbi:UNVERIFIED_CONTAM: Retrovirus-related Pol polyprotein from transposon TNT 1-94 [Sesamum radiatum]|uniref:Retrovirus-related Pol polyprotein from transposon TNT 1-94 n=1 Tax=Sesamum radiatum TaxID=300843 RepID=A0AAW2U0Y5_SESRA
MSIVGVNPSSTSQTHEESDEPRWSKRARVVKDFGSDFVTYNIEDDPITFKDATASFEAKQWKETVKSDMDSIVSNGTWVLVDLPPRCTNIGSRLTIIRVLIALVSVYNLPIHQMYVKTVFLYDELEEEIYMNQPEGFEVHGGGAVAWKFAKQTLITRSTFEVELCALDTTGTEAKWLFGWLSQLPIVSQPLPPIAVQCDSQTTIAKVRSHKYNQKAKGHIQVKLKSMRALVSNRAIGIDFVEIKDNSADALTEG